MKPRTVGVITIVDLKNYGNRLQNYAVHQLYADRGVKATTIEFTDFPLRSAARGAYYRGFKDLRDSGVVAGRSSRFAEFTRTMTPTRSMSLRHFSSSLGDFDFYSVGSDQVWNPNDRRLGGILSGEQCLAGVDRGRKVALAPSFGLSSIPSEWRERYAQWLADFGSLSVRESEGAQLVEEMIGRRPEVLIDPTMALPTERWVALQRENTAVRGPYLLTLLLGGSHDRRREELQSFARSQSLQLVDLANPRDPVTARTGPREFVSLVNGAELVVTDSFHCSVFAFMLDTPLAIVPRRGPGGSMSSRISTLASTFGLGNRLVGEDQGPLDTALLSHDYRAGTAVLERKRDQFMSYLDSEIHRVSVANGAPSVHEGESQ